MAELQGGSSKYSSHECKGAKQDSGSPCSSLYVNEVGYVDAQEGSFGSAGHPFSAITSTTIDYGGFGGGGYYGGTSYGITFGGSGGSSFISGHKGCNAVLENSDFIEHSNDSVHYSGLVFSNTTMIAGNEQMPLPNSNLEGIWSNNGAFRITLLQYMFHCTYKQSIYCFHILFLVCAFQSQ